METEQIKAERLTRHLLITLHRALNALAEAETRLERADGIVTSAERYQMRLTSAQQRRAAVAEITEAIQAAAAIQSKLLNL
jgi:hypothetical protein